MYYDNTPKDIISKQQINEILKSSHFYEDKLVYFIDEGKGGYDMDIVDQPTMSYYKEIIKMYNHGKTIVVRGMENYNKEISDLARSYGIGTDVHMYLNSGKGGTSFGFHHDEKDVIIHGVIGSKDYEIKREGMKLPYTTNNKRGILVKKYEEHRAISPKEECVILSFGLSNNALLG